MISFSISVLFSPKTHVNLVDLVQSFPTSILANIGVGTAENEPLKVLDYMQREVYMHYM